MIRSIVILCLSGFFTVACTPLVELEHVSHATQHVGSGKTQAECAPRCGYNAVSVGVRLRPAKGVTVDVLEGYTDVEYDGTHETFQARLIWEIGK